MDEYAEFCVQAYSDVDSIQCFASYVCFQFFGELQFQDEPDWAGR